MVLNRETLTRQAFDELVDHIIQRRLEPGDSLPSTAELTEEFGISRPVVREALSALQACGFVELRSGRNPVVASLDGRLIEMFVARAAHMQQKPMSGLMEVRTPLEIQAATLAAQRAETGAIDRICQLNEQMAAALHDPASYPELDTAFHSEIVGATQNHILVWMTGSIRTELMGIMIAVREYRDRHGLVGQEQKQHDEISQAIRDRQPERAADAMARHLRASTDLVRAVEEITAPTTGTGQASENPPRQ